MAPEDENAYPGVTLSSQQNIHLRISIIISRNHTGDDGAPKQIKYKVLISSFNQHPLQKLNVWELITNVKMLWINWFGTYFGRMSLVTLTLGLKYGLTESARNITNSDSTTVKTVLLNDRLTYSQSTGNTYK